MEFRCTQRISCNQARIEMIVPLFTGFLAELRPHRRIARRRFAETLQENPDIEARASDDQRKPSPLMKRLDHVSGVLPEETGVERLIRIDQVDEMMDDTLPSGD